VKELGHPIMRRKAKRANRAKKGRGRKGRREVLEALFQAAAVAADSSNQ
jgi:hypothetical protein